MQQPSPLSQRPPNLRNLRGPDEPRVKYQIDVLHVSNGMRMYCVTSWLTKLTSKVGIDVDEPITQFREAEAKAMRARSANMDKLFLFSLAQIPGLSGVSVEDNWMLVRYTFDYQLDEQIRRAVAKRRRWPLRDVVVKLVPYLPHGIGIHQVTDDPTRA
jgi:hypothetical protein